MSLFLDDEPKRDSYTVAPIPERIRKNIKAIIITSNKAESLELFYPYYRMTEEGYTVDVVSPEGGELETKHGISFKNSKTIDEVRPEDYAMLYITGGKAPEELRKNNKVLAFVKRFAQSNKPIAAICHGAQVLISAGLVQGKQIACWPEVRKELEDAGGIFIDEALVEDGQFITARMPGDLHRHLYGVLQHLKANSASQSVQRRESAA